MILKKGIKCGGIQQTVFGKIKTILNPYLYSKYLEYLEIFRNI